jgi:GntR family transcriptional regulator, arabinose operon transcriptional repressor
VLSVNGHLYERIIASVLDDVRTGRLRPGDRVPSENELAASFEVSRITSRRALEELARLSIVERSQGRGTFVARELPDLQRVGPGSTLSIETQPVTAPARGIRSGMVGLVLPDFSDTFGLQMVYAIEEATSSADLHLLLKRTYGARSNEERTINAFVSRGVDGLIVFPVHGEHYNPVLLKAVLEGYPVVMVDRYLKGIPAHAVVTDNRAAAEALTEHLIHLGHREIAFLSPPVTNTSALEERLEGFEAALNRHGLPRRPEHLLSSLLATLPTQFHPENIAADQHLLERFVDNTRATAFFCVEYNLALEFTSVLERLGKRVPEDVAVVCFDSPQIPFSSPRFTHVRQDEPEIGRIAVQRILEQLRGEHAPTRTHVQFQLVHGRSTRQIKT